MDCQELIDGKYKLLRKIGAGGTGDVYLAENINLHTYWAIKALKRTSDYEQCPLAEAEMTKHLDHPALPRLVDAIEDKEYIFFVFDYIIGKTLLEVLNEKKQISQNQLVVWIEQICDVLNYLHVQEPEPVIFRDLKPSNLMVTSNDRIKLIDFGSARIYKEGNPDDTVYLGTKGYAAPEQYGTGQSGIKTDIFNLGMTMLHLLTGNHPSMHSREDLLEQMKNIDVSEGLLEIIKKATMADPDYRYENVNEILFALQKINKSNYVRENTRVRKETTNIAVIGASAGCGVTHSTILFAWYLTQRKYRVAVVEFNESGDIRSIGKTYLEQKSNIDQGYFFTYQKIDFYIIKNHGDLLSVSKEKYDYIFLDMGCHRCALDMVEFFRADINIVCGSGCDWKIDVLRSFIAEFKEKDWENRWLYILPLVNEKQKTVLKRFLGIRNIFTLPYNPDPFIISKENSELIEKLADLIFSVPISKKKKLLIGGRKL